MDLTNLPEVDELLKAIEPTSIHIAITGHTALERVLDVAIRESLPNGDPFDLDRVPFIQELALAVGLTILDTDSVPPYRVVNAMRNKVAHDLVTTLDAEAKDLCNCLSSRQRKSLTHLISDDPLQILRDTIGCLYGELRTAVERRREGRLRAEAYNDITKETLATANYGVAWGETRRALEGELQKRVEAKKQDRGWTYESPSHDEGPWDIYEFALIGSK